MEERAQSGPIPNPRDARRSAARELVLIGGNLWGNDFHWTGESGDVARVAIDPAGLFTANSALQDTINALSWTGAAQEVPGFIDE